MGFIFAGKKKDKPDEAEAQQTKRSRRIVTPGAKAGDESAAVNRTTQTVKPPTQRVTTKGQPAPPPATTATTKPGTAGAKPSGPQTRTQSRPGSAPQTTTRSGPRPAQGEADGMLLGGDAPTKPSGPAKAPSSALTKSVQKPQSGPINAPRPPGKAPISTPKPLEFVGDIASGARGGPARTGDQALLDFLLSKANPPLLDTDQAEQVRAKAEADGIAIDIAAVQLGFLTEDGLVTQLTQHCWVPHLKVDKYEIRKKALDTISREDAEHYGVFPVDKLGSLLTLAMVNPLDTETIRALESKTGLDIKRVVATRAEIGQGIEKYYSGKVQAKEGSLAFTQDMEAKSVTQMIQNAESAAKKPAAPAPTPPPAKKKSDHLDVVPEIEDIDELLSSDEVIAPSIIEPVSIKAEEPATIGLDELEPVVEPPAKPVSERIGIDELDDLPSSAAPAAKAAAPAKPAPSKPKDDSLIDFDIDITLPESKPAAAPSAPAAPQVPMKTPLPASEMVPATGALERVAKAAPPATSAPPVKASPTKTPAPAPTAPAPVSAKAPTTSKRYSRNAVDVVNLIPVMEEEFQHAITHGRAHLFDKWVGLQTRNRIINGVQVEDDVATLLSSLMRSGRRL